MSTMVAHVGGSDLKQLDSVLMELYSPRQKVELLLGTHRALDPQELGVFSSYLRDNGVKVLSIQSGGTDEWPHAIKLELRRPLRPSGVAVFPLVLLLAGAAAVIGVTLIGWKAGTIIDRVSKQLPLLVGIAAATAVAIAFIKSKERERVRT